MIRHLRKSYYMSGAAFTLGTLSMVGEAKAAATGFNVVAQNITTGTGQLPGLITAIAYLAGTLLAVLGIMKIKDHVENPTQTPLKDGAVRLLVGGALFAIPTITDAMLQTLGTQTGTVVTPTLNEATFGTN